MTDDDAIAPEIIEAQRALEAEIRNLDPPDPDEPIMKNPVTTTMGTGSLIGGIVTGIWALVSAVNGTMSWDQAGPLITAAIMGIGSGIGLIWAKDEKAKS